MPSGPDDFLLSSLDIYLPSSGLEIYGERDRQAARQTDRDRDTRETKTERDRQRH